MAQLRSLVETSPSGALEELEQLCSKSDATPVHFRLMAAAQRALGRKDLAQKSEIQAIDAGKSQPAIRQATALISQRKFAEADRAIRPHLDRVSDDLGAATLAAEAAIGMGWPERSIPLLEMVLVRAPGYLLARTLLVKALIAVDRLVDARKLLGPLVHRMPETARFHELFAEVSAGMGDFETAIAASQAVAQLNADSAGAQVMLGNNLRFAGQKSAAANAYRTSLQI